ncbi:hypothetical protein GLAREA_02260 [Glarea lozoyensis ATCC 20868]|uniref:Uncharacterized protein n=1 Tax=Glarea lozoyensis (strain ATCC 20868 / MF5171) TaxID=1116229 RepID=S3DIH3_GLAL2|nr:uncharacterized protein GLAREA_02260 [Glarea lozoyensis ATCC 20868]EPE26348.1 hypothetical protein GLAREA_02260 [Glarea lozoyensis ATCC 20868]
MNNNPQWRPDQTREWVAARQDRERFVAHGYTVSGIPKDPEHEQWMKQQELEKQQEWKKRQEWLRNQEGAATSQSAPDYGRGQPKSAQILDPTENKTISVTVIEDTGCGISFISPEVARLCHLTEFSTTAIESRTLMGNFVSNLWADVNWMGSDNNHGRDWFYIAPDNAPIEVLVGTKFMDAHPHVFKDRAQLEPGFLNVQSEIKAAEKSQIEDNEALAQQQAAELEERKKLAKQQKPSDKGKRPASPSSSSKRSSRRKKS